MKNSGKYGVGYYMPPQWTASWVTKETIGKAPLWCSVDLRDGNQALIVPMSLEQKLEFFAFLCELGFKQIEVGFPAASETEYQFLRTLIEKDLVPDDVQLQVLTQSRSHIIKKTFEALEGAKKAIVHLYNSTSVAQREQVFRASKEEIIDIAVKGARQFVRQAEKHPGTEFQFEYSPESFTGTEPEFAVEICNAVLDEWKPTPERKAIINLPSTVQMSMPHVYATQIQYVCDHLKYRENVLVSLHPHNDRGTGVADAELGLLAGADRVEGTLFGNGERTGNVDIITLALNMYTHGVDPGLNLFDMPKIVAMSEKFTDIKIHPRQPYGGQLVFAAFSGSHQDAIAKGMAFRTEHNLTRWSVPYLPIDPTDLGREYEADVIRINSQSGKGGVAFVLEYNFGYTIPLKMREELGYMMKDISDKHHKELPAKEIHKHFKKEYVNRFEPLDLKDATFRKNADLKHTKRISVELSATMDGVPFQARGEGNGRLDAVRNALANSPYPFEYKFLTYSEHALESDSDSRAVAYVAIESPEGRTFWGVGLHEDIVYASINALISAINRMTVASSENE